jgi:hypothetical protein
MGPLLAPFVLQLGLTTPAVVPSGDHTIKQEDPGIAIAVRHQDTPVYAWGSWYRADAQLLGQALAEIQPLSLGLGFGLEVAPRVALFGEAGYSWTRPSADSVIQQEVVFTRLVARHNVHESRPVPVRINGDYDQDSYATTYDLKDAPIYRIGVDWRAADNLHIRAAYRLHSIPAKLEIYDAEWRAAGQGYWEENDTLDASGFEVQLMVTF